MHNLVSSIPFRNVYLIVKNINKIMEMVEFGRHVSTVFIEVYALIMERGYLYYELTITSSENVVVVSR